MKQKILIVIWGLVLSSVLLGLLFNSNKSFSGNVILNETSCTDFDGDGYNQTDLNCGIGDCNDNNSSIKPSAQEICDDGIDNNCNGLIDKNESICAKEKLESGAAFNDLSEYLIGKVLVKVFFVESNGAIDNNSEDWTQEEKDFSKDAVQQATNWIKYQYELNFPNAPPETNLSFIINYEDVSTSYEPITRKGGQSMDEKSGGNETIWVQEIMDNKNYKDYPLSTYYNVADYLDDQRKLFGTDWAFAIFFVDDSNDDDGKFDNTNNRSDFASGLGGPYIVIPNYAVQPSFPTPINESPSVISHEMLHMFYAVDQYSPFWNESGHSGYLDAYNLDYNSGNTIMRNPWSFNSLSPSTRKQIGWGDSNNNDVVDVLDVPPQTTITKYIINNSNLNVVASGIAVSSALENKNPYQNGAPTPAKAHVLHGDIYPWNKNNITLNRITSVEYRILNGMNVILNWTVAQPQDGSFDSKYENFTLTTPKLNAGEYMLQTRARNSAGLYDYGHNNLSIVYFSFPTAAKCTDSDGGINILLKGTTKSLITNLSKVDTCANTATLKEYYCATNGSILVTNQACGSNYTCTSGYCKLKPVCTDSDGGINITVKGVAWSSSNNLSKTDSCVGIGNVTEYYCATAGTVSSTRRACPSGYRCLSGACNITI